MKTLTAPFLGVLGQTLLAIVQFKAMYSGGPAIILVPQTPRVCDALPLAEIK